MLPNRHTPTEWTFCFFLDLLSQLHISLVVVKTPVDLKSNVGATVRFFLTFRFFSLNRLLVVVKTRGDLVGARPVSLSPFGSFLSSEPAATPLCSMLHCVMTSFFRFSK